MSTRQEKLEAANRLVTGYLVLPVACDEITQEALAANGSVISEAQLLLIMTCAFGVQTVARRLEKTVIPALDTLFVGKERGLGEFHEVCTQCGACIIGETGGSARSPPVTRVLSMVPAGEPRMENVKLIHKRIAPGH